ncbi:MAG: serine protease [Rhizonema sp. PD37]|nr:serine protease [Rhizonema sp. PD37]
MFNIVQKQFRALFLASTIVSSLVAPCFASPADTQFSNKYGGVQTQQKQISQATEQAKSNKLGKLAKSTQPAVLRIIAGCTAKIYWSDNKKTYEVTAGGSGSGYFVTADGYIVTNAHVTQLYQNKKQCVKELAESFVVQLAKDYNLSLDQLSQDKDALQYIAEHSQPQEFEQINLAILPNGDKLPFQAIASGAPVDQGRDIAILKVKIKNAPFLKLADSKQVELLDHITVVGYPGAADINILASPSFYVASFTDGKVSAKKQLPDGSPVLQISAPATHGNSGGPVLNDKGKVIGMVTFGSDVSGFIFIIPSETITQYLRQAGFSESALSN